VYIFIIDPNVDVDSCHTQSAKDSSNVTLLL